MAPPKFKAQRKPPVEPSQDLFDPSEDLFASQTERQPPSEPSQDLFASQTETQGPSSAAAATSKGLTAIHRQAVGMIGSPYSPLDTSFSSEGPPKTPAADLEIRTPTKLQVFPAREEDVDIDMEEEVYPEHEGQSLEEESYVKPSRPRTASRSEEDDFGNTGTEGDVSQHGSHDEDEAAGSRERVRVLLVRVEGRIIEWLQDNPFLYDKTQQGYRNKQKKLRVYEQFAQSLGCDLTRPELSKRVASKRTQFGKISQKVTKSGAGVQRLTAREKFLLSSFEFLRRHIARHRDTQVLGLPEDSQGAASASPQNEPLLGGASPSPGPTPSGVVGGGGSSSSPAIAGGNGTNVPPLGVPLKPELVHRTSQTDDDEDVSLWEGGPERRVLPPEMNHQRIAKKMEDLKEMICGYGRYVSKVETSLGSADPGVEYWRKNVTDVVAMQLNSLGIEKQFCHHMLMDIMKVVGSYELKTQQTRAAHQMGPESLFPRPSTSAAAAATTAAPTTATHFYHRPAPSPLPMSASPATGMDWAFGTPMAAYFPMQAPSPALGLPAMVSTPTRGMLQTPPPFPPPPTPPNTTSQ